MNCRNCGAPLPPDARFCRRCGTDVPQTPPAAPKKSILKKPIAAVRQWFDKPIFHNKKALLSIGGSAALLVLLLVLILSIASCAPKKLKTPEAVADAVIGALEKGDGKALAALANLSEPLTGQHPEVFGEGETPEKVMRGYYDRLAGDLYARLKEQYGKRFTLEGALSTRILTGSDIWEANRSLDLDAAQYAELTGPLTVNGETVANARIVAVELNGEWKLLVVYLY